MILLALLSAFQSAAPAGAALPTPPQGVHDALDSVVVRSPLPDPLIPFVQFMFQQPGWALGLEVVIGGLTAAAVAWYMWTRRIWMFGWFRGTSRGAQAAFVGANLAVVLTALAASMYGYHYTMHDNDFCKGCHIFVPSGQAWVRPDTGNYLLVNALEGKHDTLSCHSCHPFEIKAQTVELLLWIADRPQDVPPHGRVPRAVCERCHVQGEAKESWQRIAATAGHSVHLAQDSTKHGGRIQCLTCHARTAHRFRPSDSTCTKSGCHETNTIKLGRMAGQTSFHCTLCHEFTAPHAPEVTPDSAKGLLIPGGKQCLACHGMQQLTVSFDFSKDPHRAKCGTCHNPHIDRRPRDADSTCAGCHTNWREVPFHTGAIHRGAVRPTACTQCHQPHAARVDASNCTGCHAAQGRRSPGHGGILPPMPFDTAAALRTSALPPPPEPRAPHAKGDAPVAEEPPPWRADSFPHARHQSLPCITCHDPRSTKKLTFDPGRGCQICHHQDPERNDCARCHVRDSLPGGIAVTLTVAVRHHAPVPRAGTFDHAAHTARNCVECHRTPVTLAPPRDVLTCTACHESHGAGTASCVACHSVTPDSAVHAPPVVAHRACAACHQREIVATLNPTRVLCLTCHQPQRDHKPGAECTTCHMQVDPATYRPQLTDRSGH